MFSKFSKKIGIDLGTANVRVCTSSSNEVLNEFNILMLDVNSGEYVKTGSDALNLIGKESAEYQIIKPVKNGVLQDIEAQKELLYPMVDSLIGRHRIIKPEIIISIPRVLRDSDRNSILSLVEELGGHANCYLVPEVILSALGLKLSIYSSTGTAIVNMGAGTVETAILSSGGVNSSYSLQFGGEDLDQLIIDYFKSNNLLIGIKSAENLKKNFLSAEVEDKNLYLDIKGKEISSGRAIIHNFKADDLRVAILPGLEKIANSIKNVIEDLPPELSGDVLDKGIVITGGLSKLRKFNSYLSSYLNVPVYRFDNPENSTILGLQFLSNNIDLISKTIKL
jgi:rod shape-determining protein MreB